MTDDFRALPLRRLVAARHRGDARQPRLRRPAAGPRLALTGLTVTVDGAGAGQPRRCRRSPCSPYGPGDVLGFDPRHVVRTEPKDVDAQLRAELPGRHRVRLPRLPLAVHAGRARRGPAPPVARADRAEERRVHPGAGRRHSRCPRSTSPSSARCSRSTTPGTGRTRRCPATPAWPRRGQHARPRSSPGCCARAGSIRRPATPRSWCPRSRSAAWPGSAWIVSGLHSVRPGLDRRHPGAAPAAGVLQLHASTPATRATSSRWCAGSYRASSGADIGQRPMSVDDPMPDFPCAGPPLGLDGALQSLVTTRDAVERPGQDRVPGRARGPGQPSRRRSPTTRPTSADDPQVVPPIYGRWHAGVADRDARARPAGSTSSTSTRATAHRRRAPAPRWCRRTGPR